MIAAGRARHRGIGFDRIIDADRPIRGTLTANPGADGDMTVRWHEPVPHLRSDVPLWTVTEDGASFVAPGVACYRCTPTEIEVTPSDRTSSSMVEALLVATALPASLWLAGCFMLHAAAVIPTGEHGAIAIVGPSGIGKSRLADAFLAQGARLVADDSLSVRCGDRAAICAGLAGGYHLDAPGSEDRAFHIVPARQARRSAPLAAVVVLVEAGSAATLAGAGAVEALLANRHRPNVPRLCRLEARGLDQAARLARSVPVYQWSASHAVALLDVRVRESMTNAGGDR